MKLYIALLKKVFKWSDELFLDHEFLEDQIKDFSKRLWIVYPMITICIYETVKYHTVPNIIACIISIILTMLMTLHVHMLKKIIKELG